MLMATSVPLISELSTASSSCAISGKPSAKLSTVSGSCSSSSGEPPMKRTCTRSSSRISKRRDKAVNGAGTQNMVQGEKSKAGKGKGSAGSTGGKGKALKGKGRQSKKPVNNEEASCEEADRKETVTTRRRLLRAEERKEVADISRETLVSFVCDRVPGELAGELFPERLQLWEVFKSTPCLRTIVDTAVARYLKLYSECSKGRDKYAQLFLRWLDVVRSYTCEAYKTEETKGLLQSAMEKCHQLGVNVSDCTKRTVTAIILNATYQGIQQQMANKIEEISFGTSESGITESSDIVALHRICGWALKSAIDTHHKHLKAKPSSDMANELNLLEAMKLPSEAKQSLPLALQCLDRGGLTFIQSPFVPWMQGIEEKMVKHLNADSYRRYGQKLFQATKASFEMDYSLLELFQRSVEEAQVEAAHETVAAVHAMLVTKIYNARCNEYLRTIGKLSCIDRKKAVDVNVGLRDQLKTYAAERMSLHKD